MREDTNVKYYKGRYLIAFYKDNKDKTDERLFATFDNPIDICKYRKLPLTENNLAQIKVELCNALRRNPSTTRMLNGSSMKVYLVDMLEEKEEQERRDKCMAKKSFVKVSSSITIEVYGNLEAVGFVNNDKKLTNAKAGWAKIKVLLTQGTAWYPSEILEWETIKKLAAKELITIGEQVDEIKDPKAAEKATEEKKAIQRGVKALISDKEKASSEKAEEKPASKVI